MDDPYWTVTYLAVGRRWWVVGGLLGWGTVDDWTFRHRFTDKATAQEAFRIFRRNPKNHQVRLVRVTRKPTDG